MFKESSSPIMLDGDIKYSLANDGRLVTENRVKGILRFSNESLALLKHNEIINKVLSITGKGAVGKTAFVRSVDTSFATKVADHICAEREWRLSKGRKFNLVSKVFFGNTLLGYVFSGLGYISLASYKLLPECGVSGVLSLDSAEHVIKLRGKVVQGLVSSCNTLVFGVDSEDKVMVDILRTLRHSHNLEVGSRTGVLLNTKSTPSRLTNIVYIVESKVVLSQVLALINARIGHQTL